MKLINWWTNSPRNYLQSRNRKIKYSRFYIPAQGSNGWIFIQKIQKKKKPYSASSSRTRTKLLQYKDEVPRETDNPHEIDTFFCRKNVETEIAPSHFLQECNCNSHKQQNTKHRFAMATMLISTPTDISTFRVLLMSKLKI
jgi:hypothetical protein